jgi:hypothetical protein
MNINEIDLLFINTYKHNKIINNFIINNSQKIFYDSVLNYISHKTYLQSNIIEVNTNILVSSYLTIIKTFITYLDLVDLDLILEYFKFYYNYFKKNLETNFVNKLNLPNNFNNVKSFHIYRTLNKLYKNINYTLTLLSKYMKTN